MSPAILKSRALTDMEAPEITTKTNLANGQPSFAIVGPADTEAEKARES
jgi:magnesium chelatase family protein